MKQTTTPPPYTNRWGTEPGPNFRRCQAETRKGTQCRRGALKGKDLCDAHDRNPKTRAILDYLVARFNHAP